MLTITANQACETFHQLIDKTAESHTPVVITGKNNNVVMISQQDWSAIEETLYLNSMPNLANELIARSVSHDADFISEEEMNW